jgi:preprotein translocase subunit YajC
MLMTVLLQADGGAFGSLLPLLLVIVVMYFFFFRPQMKRQKEEKKFQQDVAKGMRVVTTSGIHGKILSVEDSAVILESENTRLKVEKSAINKQMSEVYLAKSSGKDEKEKEKEEKSKDKK